MRIMKKELFNNTGVFKFLPAVSEVEFKAFEFNELNEKEFEECTIRTDAKYLAEVKRIEMNMFIENKRRIKYMKLKDDDEKQSSDGSVMSKKRKRDEEVEINVEKPKPLRSTRGKSNIDRVVELYQNSDCVNKPIRSRRNKVK
jgi:nitrous oxidase accessory protein NosD